MSQKCYNFVAEFVNNANMEEKTIKINLLWQQLTRFM